MRFLVRAIIYIAVLGSVALIGFAVFSDLPAPRAEISRPIDAM
jgi:hypothetical protein